MIALVRAAHEEVLTADGAQDLGGRWQERDDAHGDSLASIAGPHGPRYRDPTPVPARRQVGSSPSTLGCAATVAMVTVEENNETTIAVMNRITMTPRRVFLSRGPKISTDWGRAKRGHSEGHRVH